METVIDSYYRSMLHISSRMNLRTQRFAIRNVRICWRRFRTMGIFVSLILFFWFYCSFLLCFQAIPCQWQPISYLQILDLPVPSPPRLLSPQRTNILQSSPTPTSSSPSSPYPKIPSPRKPTSKPPSTNSTLFSPSPQTPSDSTATTPNPGHSPTSSTVNPTPTSH